MSIDSAAPSAASAGREAGAQTLRGETEAVYVALGAGLLGALYGLVISLMYPDMKIQGAWSLGAFATGGASLVAIVVSATGYWRSRDREGQEWRRSLAPWKAVVNTVSVVIVHTALAYLATYVMFALLAAGFVGLRVAVVFAVVMMAIALGLTGYLVFLSVSRMTTQRMSSLLMAFIVLGTLTAMVTTPDKEWWKMHFSQLGTYDDMSSWIFNGTLIAGGLLVTTFAVYISHDMRQLVEAGRLSNEASPRTVSTLFAVMGIMLACVGIFPVDVNMPAHNISASGMAVMFLVLLIGGARFLRGMPRTYFVAATGFLIALLVSIVLFFTRYFSLTAFEIIVFGLIFGWIAVFIRFLAVTGQQR